MTSTATAQHRKAPANHNRPLRPASIISTFGGLLLATAPDRNGHRDMIKVNFLVVRRSAV